MVCLPPSSIPEVSLTSDLAITKFGKKLHLRQRVIATAIVFFKRFYLKSSYCDTHPMLVVAACCYVASKAEESPVHIKTVVSEARQFLMSMFRYSTLYMAVHGTNSIDRP
jgi:cyclin C